MTTLERIVYIAHNDRLVHVAGSQSFTPGSSNNVSVILQEFSVRPGTAEFGHNVESPSEVHQTTFLTTKNQFGWETKSVPFFQNQSAEIKSAEFGFEASGITTISQGGLGALSAEFSYEAGSPTLRQRHNIAVNHLETGWETFGALDISQSGTPVTPRPNIIGSTVLTSWAPFFTSGATAPTITRDATDTPGPLVRPRYDLGSTGARCGITLNQGFTAGVTYTFQIENIGTVPFVFNLYDGVSGANDTTSPTFTPSNSLTTRAVWTTPALARNYISVSIVYNNSSGAATGTNIFDKVKCEQAADATAYIDPAVPVTGGRNFLLGFYGNGSAISSYFNYLGYHPEVTINNGGEDNIMGGDPPCGGGYSGAASMNNYPVICYIWTVHNDFAGSANGNYDSCYHTSFSDLANSASHLYALRLDTEWDNRVGAGNATTYKASFDRIVGIAKQHLPARIKYIFNPNRNGGATAAFIPNSCDIVGVDSYNNPQYPEAPGGSLADAQRKFDPNNVGSVGYWCAQAKIVGKPFAIPEWGDDYGTGDYVNLMADMVFDRTIIGGGTTNNVVLSVYWDSPDNEDAHLRNGSLTAFQNQFANKAYTGTYWGNPLIPTTSFMNY